MCRKSWTILLATTPAASKSTMFWIRSVPLFEKYLWPNHMTEIMLCKMQLFYLNKRWNVSVLKMDDSKFLKGGIHLIVVGQSRKTGWWYALDPVIVYGWAYGCTINDVNKLLDLNLTPWQVMGLKVNHIGVELTVDWTMLLVEINSILKVWFNPMVSSTLSWVVFKLITYHVRRLRSKKFSLLKVHPICIDLTQPYCKVECI